VNDKVDDFGGILIVRGRRDRQPGPRLWRAGLDRRTHGREIRTALKRWGEFLTAIVIGPWSRSHRENSER
jgi:hypothetical protein